MIYVQNNNTLTSGVQQSNRNHDFIGRHDCMTSATSVDFEAIQGPPHRIDWSFHRPTTPVRPKWPREEIATHTAGCPAAIQRFRKKSPPKSSKIRFKNVQGFFALFFRRLILGPHFWTGLFGCFLETKLKFCVGSHHSPRFHLASQSWPHPELHLPPA